MAKGKKKKVKASERLTEMVLTMNYRLSNKPFIRHIEPYLKYTTITFKNMEGSGRVYALLNEKTNEFYVGSTVKRRGLKARFGEHVERIEKDLKGSDRKYERMRRYPKEEWICIPLKDLTKSSVEVLRQERKLIRKWNPSLNTTYKKPAGVERKKRRKWARPRERERRRRNGKVWRRNDM